MNSTPSSGLLERELSAAKKEITVLTKERDEALRFANGKLGESAKDMMHLRAQVETLTRERDEARCVATVNGNAAYEWRDATHKAQMQVETLAKALREIGVRCLSAPGKEHNANTCWGCISTNALKAAGLEGAGSE